ncbi:aminotransferase class III-fold pyridoxal phosphate-dependent enzyme [Flagellimonas nanhaiensis]|uniref:Aminotransferase class III-fold pyridoxal phosphate-dependent enzyme n=1 Tax=Flagellimonas nanhaiensis TaxID=2292706 RepID=A0A371JW14_9FLAO|nr:aminotransferase class III-fold pyridoxal phosphate-dependent enzyme [Allomuricauda nanhaiensis]RDY61983.1 aminotransferase class III-fold pyridoxal phosphate-dependent enzyme [Allomuricauda nanhaiensis]
MEYQILKVSPEQAESILLQLFNIEGSASSLPGEIDFNFKIKTTNGDGYILKISRVDEDTDYLDYQQQLLQYVEKKGGELISPRVVKDKNGKTISEYTDDQGNIRKVRLLSWISGRLWSKVNPQMDELRFTLGKQCGLLTTALQAFDHPLAHRDFEWDVAKALWTKQHLDLFNKEEKEILSYFIELFENYQHSYSKLQKSIVHNDANDNNIIVTGDLVNTKVKAFIDYGDAIHTQVINDVAIACAYAIMNHNEALDAALPIVKGYHATFPLTQEDLEHLYVAIAMRLAISVTKSALNKIKEPDNTYLLVSEKPAWEVLRKWFKIDPDFAHYCFRQACGLTAHPQKEKFDEWAQQNSFSLESLFPTAPGNNVFQVDLSVSSLWVGHQEEFNDLELLQFKFERLQKEHPDKVIAGGYLEPRALYTSSAYDKAGNSGRESRTVHLGVDFWLPSDTPVHALFDGEVVTATNDEGDKEYGGLVILKHSFNQLEFYTLYGHLLPESATQHKIGDLIKKGGRIGVLGNFPENGNWAPHLHFQIMFSMLGYKNDFPGVAYPNQLAVWKDLCPDPNHLFKIENLKPPKRADDKSVIDFRKKHLGKSLSLQYKRPIKMVRGSGQYLIDQHGRKYLDTVNNVAHVGHENHAVVKVGQQQMALLNTNSRYLHENINALTEELLETLPPELSVLHFVNSGSEANELAIRMVKAVTGEKDIIASEVGYHGNSNMCVDISSYKFDGKGGSGAPEHTHIFPLPDAFRGKYRGKDTGKLYAKEVQNQIEAIHAKGRGMAAFIIEPIISCGGQVELPDEFLRLAYEHVRKAGGLCISDEVQVGCGRMGRTFWGFQLHNATPDIITIGKPLGNGHPLAAVACTLEVAEKFDNGMEYFNTFGGNPVSCAIGTEVLRTIKREKLQENAHTVGTFLKEELKKLSPEFPILGDVRGQGLFLGFELVDANLKPLGDKADYLINRMKDHGILMSTDGPDHNVIKIKPPLVFSIENAEELIFYLKKVFAEDFMIA